MATYRTPDVYVEELSVFPPSVAEVETAIPAFIGYTQKATRTIDGDLLNVPTKVVSLLEYQSLFGGAPQIKVDSVVLDDASNFVSAGISKTKHLYDSLRLFFDNGGGKCYIVSVGNDTATTDEETLKTGLDQVARVDEPTILLFPDAAELDAGKLAAVQQRALAQCGKLGDRVALLDTAYYKSKAEHDTQIANFRGKIGINNLKYGMAYAPWLKLGYAKSVGYTDIKSVLKKGGAATNLSALTGDPDIKAKIDLLDKALADKTAITARIAPLANPQTNVSLHMEELLRTYSGTPKTATTLQVLFAYVMQITKTIDGMATGATALTHQFTPPPPPPPATAVPQGVLPSVQNLIKGQLKTALSNLISLEKELKAAEATYTPQWDSAPTPAATDWDGLFGANAPTASTSIIPTGAGVTTSQKLDAALPGLNTAFSALNGALAAIAAEAENWRKNHEQFLYDNFPVYRGIIDGVAGTLAPCPPSGAIAGIYAMVDNQRGIWKAPANVSLAGVVEPTYYFDSDDTDNLNVDPVAGKSINAIRAFAGKGTLVWGARTLAGNDNEWRYVPVRRFFNMVEESVKKSTYWAVFEPNDANTWVKVRGMIENYLTQKWREGALAGATTKDAFFVRCGLGVTMAPQDILEGRLNVEVGMAVVRPAEFIVLKFSHKLQTA